MNFKEFEELISSGAEEIALTEDVVLDFSDEEIDKDCIEISKRLIVEGNGHCISLNIQNMDFIVGNDCIYRNIQFDSCNNLKITLKDFVKLENCTFKNFELINQESLHIYNCNFEHSSTKLINESRASTQNSKIHEFINYGEAYFKNSELMLSNGAGGDVGLLNCKISDLDNDGKLILYDCILNDYMIINNGSMETYESIFTDIQFVNDHSYFKAFNCKFIDNSNECRYFSIINRGSTLILDSCEFTGENKNIIANENSVENIDRREYTHDDETFECKSEIIIKNSNFENHHQIVTFTDIIALNNNINPSVIFISGSESLDRLIHTHKKEIKLDNYFQLENRISIDVDDLVIDGCGNTIEAIRNGIFDIKSDNVTLKNVNFINANVTKGGPGGAILNYGKNLKIINCHFENNIAFNIEGGAIHNKKGTIHIQNTVFKKNTADYDEEGGAIANIDGEIILENCKFIGNRSGRYGGAIYNEDGSLSILNCNFSDNYVTYLGESCSHIADAIFNLDGEVNIENSNFDNRHYDDLYNSGFLNISKSDISGDIWNVGCLSIKKCQFEEGTSIENSALIYMLKSEEEYIKNFIKTFRGKIWVPNFILPICDTHTWKGKIRYFDDLVDDENENDFSYLNDLINSNLKDLNDDDLEIHLDNDIINKDDNFEKGIEINAKKLVIDGNGHSIDANSKSSIFNISSSNIVLRRIVFKNSFSCNLAAINVLNTNITFENCIFESNDSVKRGGSLNIKDSSLKAVDCEFTDNFALDGGAIYADNSSIELSGCNFSMNNVNGVGGAFKLDDSDLISIKSNFNNNIAKDGAVGFFTSSNSCFQECGFKNNLSIDNGGVIYSILSRAKFEGCIFEDNKSGYSSIVYGAVKDNFIFKKSNFKNNRAKSSLILLSLAPHSLDGKEFLSNKLYCAQCNFENNICSKYALIGVGQLYMSDCDFRNNQYGDELIDVKEYLLSDNDDFLESKIKAERVIENANIEIDFKNLIGSGKKDISLKSDYIFFEDGELDVGGLCIDGQMHEITGNLTITGKNATLKHIIFKDTVKIENNDTATLENCSFESNKNEVIINKANLTLKNCSFKEKHKILNTGDVTLIDYDGAEVLTDEIIELYEEESVGGLGALFGKPRKKRPKKTKINPDEEKANFAFRTLFGR